MLGSALTRRIGLEENYDSAEVMVVLPAYITLKIVPFSSEGDAPSTRTSAASANFYLISGLKYKVMVEVYDSDSHKISATDVRHCFAF